MRITKGDQINGGNSSLTKIVSNNYGGVVLTCTSRRGVETRIFISAVDMDNITTKIKESDAARKAKQEQIERDFDARKATDKEITIS